MHKIIKGVKRFQNTVFVDQREHFEMLARKQQSPIALFITCSDSRINPNLITSTDPGDLFLLRNAGNIIPPSGAASGGESATIEYAVSVLRIPNIIVCGHYGCGAMHHLMRSARDGRLQAVSNWFSHAESTRRIVQDRFGHLPIERQDELAIEMNVLVQLDNLRTHPSVALALACGELSLYGWVYRIETGEVFAYDPVTSRFHSVDEREPIPYPSVPALQCGVGS